MPRSRYAPLLYRLLRRVPTRMRLLLVYFGSPKLTVGVSAIVWDPEGRVLIVRHTYRHPAWGFPSGLVGYEEAPNAALERELHEELGVHATSESLLHAETHARAHHLTLYYQMSLQGEPHHNGIEIDALRYAGLEELENIAGAPAAKWLWAAQDQRGHAHYSSHSERETGLAEDRAPQ
jgi:8-oxo-dGTP pyrophosphatase MutT (NUDIX family)